MKFTIENLKNLIEQDKNIKHWTWEKFTRMTEKQWVTDDMLKKIPTEQQVSAYRQEWIKTWTIPYRYINTKERAKEWVDDLALDNWWLEEVLEIDMETEVECMNDMLQEAMGESIEDMGLEDAVENSILVPWKDELRYIYDKIEEME